MAGMKILTSLVLVLVAAVVVSADKFKDVEQMEKKPMRYTVTEEVYFDVLIEEDKDEDDYRGRFVVAVFGDIAPMTVLNFQSIAKGYKRGKTPLHYKGSHIHRIVPDFIIQMGDVTKKDGTGGTSIYGDKFVDENFYLSHKAAGYVSMANHGKDTNGSQFFILLNRARWLDTKHVVFGKVIRGMDVVKKIGEIESNKDNAVPLKKVTIVDCGTNGIEKKYDLTEEQMSSDEDIS
ncbi:uncharacterized protein [Argopecten irradians]|uniref:uncharacterized protein n=1 Tax=Argopecten irradians TaxID=31199 RepID=UPI00371BDF31